MAVRGNEDEEDGGHCEADEEGYNMKVFTKM